MTRRRFRISIVDPPSVCPETAKTTRCGHETKSGPCVRPEGHTPNGHMSKAVLDTKHANLKAKKSGDPGAIAAREARNAERHAKKVEKLEADAAALGYKVVPLTRREKAAAPAA